MRWSRGLRDGDIAPRAPGRAVRFETSRPIGSASMTPLDPRADHSRRVRASDPSCHIGNPSIRPDQAHAASGLSPPAFTQRRHNHVPAGQIARETVAVWRSAGHKPNRTRSRSRTSVTTSAGAFAAKTARRAFQSRFLTWSARITPVIAPSVGSATSNGYPFV